MGGELFEGSALGGTLITGATMALVIGCGSADDTAMFSSPSRSTWSPSASGGESAGGTSATDPALCAAGGAAHAGGSGGTAQAEAGPPSPGGASAGAGVSGGDAGGGLPVGGPITVECRACATEHCAPRTEDCLEDGPCVAYFQCFATCTVPCWDCLFSSMPGRAHELLKCTTGICPGVCPEVQ